MMRWEEDFELESRRHLYRLEEEKPMERDPGLQLVVDNFARLTYGRTMTEAVSSNICVSCGESVSYDINHPWYNEYHNRSGLCEKCFTDITDPDCPE